MTKKTLLRLVPIVVLLLVVILALPLIKPAAPRELDLFTTPQGTSQYGYAQQYAELLSGGGIEVQIIETEGVVDTLRRLGENDRAAAFSESSKRLSRISPGSPTGKGSSRSWPRSIATVPRGASPA